MQHDNAHAPVLHQDVSASGLQLMEAHARATKLPHKLSVSPPSDLAQPEHTLDSAEGAGLWPVGSSSAPSDMQ